jgi:hypothetical protein
MRGIFGTLAWRLGAKRSPVPARSCGRIFGPPWRYEPRGSIPVIQKAALHSDGIEKLIIVTQVAIERVTSSLVYFLQDMCAPVSGNDPRVEREYQWPAQTVLSEGH